jgi:hypothetical protein
MSAHAIPSVALSILIDVWVGIASLLSAADDWLVSRKLADHLVGLVGVHVFEGLPRLEPLVAAA